MVNGRAEHGRFAPGNAEALAGGHARAERIAADRRQAIARAAGRRGFQALADRYFGGDRQAAGEYVGALGRWAYFETYSDTPAVYKPGVCPRPRLGMMPGLASPADLADEIAF